MMAVLPNRERGGGRDWAWGAGVLPGKAWARQRIAVKERQHMPCLTEIQTAVYAGATLIEVAMRERGRLNLWTEGLQVTEHTGWRK